MELELIKLLGSYPFVFNETFHDSELLRVNKSCIKRCKDRECIVRMNTEVDEFICHKGYNCVPFNFNGQIFMYFGLILSDNSDIKRGTKEIQKQYLVRRDVLNVEMQKVKKFEDIANKSVIQNFSLFHDVKSSNAIAYRIVEDYIFSQSGSEFHIKLDRVDQEIKDLYDAIELVTKQLEIIDVMVNPEIPEKSKVIDANLFKLVHKLKKLFNRRAHKEGITLNVEGYDEIPNGKYKDVIILVPIILIENAIKYSEKRSTVEIHLSRYHGKNLISISSCGKVVPEEETTTIFHKFKRGSNTESYTSRGMGMGLWVANNILKEHGSHLTYRNSNINKESQIGINIFEFMID